MGVYLETPEEPSNHIYFLILPIFKLFFFLFLVSACSVAVRESQQVRSCPGQRGMLLWEWLLPFPAAEAFTGTSELQQDVTGGGKGEGEVFWEDE